jgi:acylpyruvate hydrolase
MRLVTYETGGQARVGAVIGDEVVELYHVAPELPSSLKSLIASGVPADLADRVSSAPASARRPLAAVKLMQPIPDPGKVLCVGLNYYDHAEELGQSAPDYPSLFMRATTSLIAAGEPLIVPRVSDELDYEAELVIVIGKTCRDVSEADALDYVFGYTCMNEATVRDYQRKTSQWTVAKNFDASGPIGPWITTADELPPGAHGLRIRTILNGQLMQDASTAMMIFCIARIVSLLSEVLTLEPGDLISTGTPAGVGGGRKPPVWLKPGDTVTVDIEGVGVLTNPVAAAPRS